jgi:hypothetical protein
VVLLLIGQQRAAQASAPNPTATPISAPASQVQSQAATDAALTSLTWKHATNGYGEVRLGKNAADDACKLNGRTYADCLGLHADAELVYAIGGYRRFTAVVGLDDDVNDPVTCDVAGHYYQTASVRFQIYADSELIYDTGDLNKDDRTRPVDVAIPANASTLRIVVGDVDGKITCDMADIGDGHLWASGATDSTPAPTRTPSPTIKPTRKATLTTTPAPTQVSVRTQTPAPTAGPKPVLGYRMYVPLVVVSESDGEGLPQLFGR